MQGTIIGIFTYPKSGAAGISHSSVEVVAGAGIVGDRYYKRHGTFSKEEKILPKQEITFIESEEIDLFNSENDCQLGYSELRRNIVTQGLRLNGLVGKEFQFGDKRFRGIELCQPCAHLAKTVESKLLPAMVGKCGLRTQIINNGELILGSTFSFC